MKRRLQVIACALLYGIIPWFVYEERCHYPDMTYWAHLLFNLRYAWKWMKKEETEEDWEFEKKINGA